MKAEETYLSPLVTRYASKEASFLFSPQYKYTTWRTLWIALASAQKELGLNISSEQIAEMEANLATFDWEKIFHYEKETKHDVMAHIKAFADLCPKAAPIIHLGATSAFVQDNGELLQIYEGLILVEKRLLTLMRIMGDVAKKYASLPTLSYTHFQPAQPTTFGKRVTLWLQDFLFDFHDLEYRRLNFAFLGVKGATGTQASLKALLGDKSEKLDLLVAKKMGFKKTIKIASQTYPRKVDAQVLDLLSQIAISAHKCATDLRLLAHLKEVEEPFEKSQVGSSAMPYKRNPILCERISSLSRFLIALGENPRYTAALQWLERSLDDSANKRITIPEAFLACDSILRLLCYVMEGLTIYPKMIEKNYQDELPFLALENILMEGVKKGKNRQEFHELLRKAALETKEKHKEGVASDLFATLEKSLDFPFTKKELTSFVNIENFIGNAPAQVHDFLQNELFPILEKHHQVKSDPSSIEV